MPMIQFVRHLGPTGGDPRCNKWIYTHDKEHYWWIDLMLIQGHRQRRATRYPPPPIDRKYKTDGHKKLKKEGYTFFFSQDIPEAKTFG